MLPVLATVLLLLLPSTLLAEGHMLQPWDKNLTHVLMTEQARTKGAMCLVCKSATFPRSSTLHCASRLTTSGGPAAGRLAGRILLGASVGQEAGEHLGPVLRGWGLVLLRGRLRPPRQQHQRRQHQD